MNIIELANLNAFYGDKKVLNNINMKIKKNKITAIIGPSGCGKSTLLAVLNRMIGENGGSIEGKVTFNGKDILNYPKNELRRKVGIVFQKPSPFPLSIYGNLAYAPLYYGVKDKNLLDNIVENKLKISGLYEEVKDDFKCHTELGGQQQRLIARALTVEPDVLLMDEPCSALDIKNTANIEDMLLNLLDDYTIIIVTHNLFQAKRISDYTVFILDGEIVEFGETEQIFNNPRDIRTKEYIEGMYG